MAKRWASLVPVAAFFMMLLLASAPTAEAATYNITNCQFGSGCGPAGTVYAVVTLNQNGTGVNLTIHPNSPYGFAKTGAVDFMAILFSANGVSLSDITGISSAITGGGTRALTAVAGSFSASGIGSFGFGISCAACGNGFGAANRFTNDITFNVGTALVSDFTGFAADLGNTTTGLTGPAGVGAVPEPSTLYLYGGGLSLLGFAYFFRRKGAFKNLL